VGVSLYFLYAVSVVQLLRHFELSSLSLVELLVILTQGLRVFGVAAYYRGRPARADVLLIVFSPETFLVLGLITLSIATSDASYAPLAGTIFSTWVAALFTILPFYLIFAALTQMARNRSLVAVLLPIGMELGLLAYIATTLLGFSGIITFAGFFDFLVSASRSQVPTSAISAISGLSILVPSVAVYCSLLVYATIPTATSAIQPRVNFVLPLLSAAVSLGWVYASILILPNSLLSFTLPGFALVAVLWGYMRR
jgi:hypothetical protein